MAAEHQQAALVVHHHLAERFDRIRRQLRGWKGCGVVALAASIEGRTAFGGGDRARARIDDQPAALIDNAGIAPRIIRRIAVLTLHLLELVPARLLVGDIGLPLDFNERAVVAAALDSVADLERTPLR